MHAVVDPRRRLFWIEISSIHLAGLNYEDQRNEAINKKNRDIRKL
jgi:membrane protease subunit (stomatin/prohibitin family)